MNNGLIYFLQHLASLCSCVSFVLTKVEGHKPTILSLLKFKNSRFSKDLVREKLASLSIPKLLPHILFFSLRRYTALQNFVLV